MSVTRRAQLVLGVLVGFAMVLTGGWVAHAQTTTAPTTSTTRAATTTSRAVTSTSRPSSTTTTTTRRPPNRLTFTASPAIGSPGTNITLASVNPCTRTGNNYVLLSIGQFRLGSGAPDASGNWRITVVVPQINVGTYGLSATCLVSRNGVDENAGIYTGPEFTVTQGSGPPPPTTPDVHGSNNTPLLVGLIVAIVVAIAAIAYAIYQHRKRRREAAATGTAPGAPRGPGAGPPDTFA
jgi:hypothetical protein